MNGFNHPDEKTVKIKSSTNPSPKPTPSSADALRGPFSPDNQIGDYRILELLGHGGMGYVYRAWQKSMNRHVALKVLVEFPSTAPPEESLKAEIGALVKLKHANIVSLYGFEYLREFPCLIMELVDGVPLHDYAKQQRLTFRQIAELLLSLTETMAHAHAQHVFHRDLKPSNVIVRADGRPVITDFGLAYLRNAYGVTGGEGPCGTVAYNLPPEMLRDPPAPVSAITEVFGMGGILFYLLTQQPVYVGDKKTALDAARKARTIEPRHINKRIPRVLDQICVKALAENPADRFNSMEEFAAALRSFLSRRKRRQKLAIALTALSALLLLGASALFILPRLTAPSSDPPLPPLSASAEIHFQRADEEGISHILTEREVPLRTGDRVQIHARLNRAAHLCILSIDPKGAVSVLFPTPEHPTDPRASLQLPEHADQWFPLTDPPGTELILLVAHNTPLQPDQVVAAIRTALATTGSLPPLQPTCLAVIHQHAVQLRFDRSRTLGTPEKSDPGTLQHLVRALTEKWNTVSGVSFPHVPAKGDASP